MNMRTTDALAQFCAEQCMAFDPQAWAAQNPEDKITLRALARYLAQTSWYGHEEDLELIAGEVVDSGRVSVTQEEPKASVDLVYFSVTVRRRIAELQGKSTRTKEVPKVLLTGIVRDCDLSLHKLVLMP